MVGLAACIPRTAPWGHMLICSGMRSRRLGRAILDDGHMAGQGVFVEDGLLYEGITVPRVRLGSWFSM